MKEWSITILSDLSKNEKGITTLIYSIKKWSNFNHINLILKKGSDYSEITNLVKLLDFTYDIFVIDDEKFFRRKKISFSQFDELKHIPKFVLLKIFIPEIIGNKKTLYLDTDIILNGNFNQNNIPISKKKIFAVNNGKYAPEYWFRKYEGIYKNPNEVSLKAWNAGVIFFNENNNEKKYFKKKIKALRKKCFKYLDQSFLNYIYKNDVEYLDVKYNFPVHIDNNKKFIGIEPVILHFASNRKPWIDDVHIPDWNSNAKIWFEVWRKQNNEVTNLVKGLNERERERESEKNINTTSKKHANVFFN